jgi:hypothetical protein
VQHEQTEHIAAPPDAGYAAIADVSNLPRFVPRMTAARPAEDDRVEVDARDTGVTSTARRRSTPMTPSVASNGARRAATAAGCRSRRTGTARVSPCS